MGNHRSKIAKDLVGKLIKNQKIKSIFYDKGHAKFEVCCNRCNSVRTVRYGDVLKMDGEFCNNCFSFETFKNNFYKKFPNSEIKILKKDKNKVIIKDNFGYCKIESKYLISNGTSSISNAIFPQSYFLNRIKRLLGDGLYYNNAFYKDFYTKINLTCKKHGSFLAKMCNINNGIGCFKCKNEKEKTKNFIKAAKKVHGNTYSYKNCLFLDSTKKVVITCKTHGDFKQLPSNHLNNSGCKKCATAKTNIDQIKNFNLRSYSGWQKTGEKSKKFDSFKIYIVKFFNKNEEFYKIGKTFLTVKDRFNKEVKLGYKYEVIKTIVGEAIYISKLEKKLHEQHKEHFYTPLIPFKGMNECFKVIYLDKIEKAINAN